jgi:hypothetical protein
MGVSRQQNSIMVGMAIVFSVFHPDLQPRIDIDCLDSHRNSRSTTTHLDKKLRCRLPEITYNNVASISLRETQSPSRVRQHGGLPNDHQWLVQRYDFACPVRAHSPSFISRILPGQTLVHAQPSPSTTASSEPDQLGPHPITRGNREIQVHVPRVRSNPSLHRGARKWECLR